MNEITLKLETVTPLFLGGFDPRDEPELRPPAIRGALRYWLRAAIGGVVGDKDRDKLSDLENQVFGKADDKIGASAITLRFRNPTFRSASYSVLTGVDAIRKTIKYPGMAYLWFSARGTKKEKERYALVGEFRLEIQSRLGVKQAHQRFQEAYLALWLWLNLGGLGSRARRAGGNLQVMDVEGNFPLLGNLPLKISAKTPQELATELEVGITQCRKLLSESYFPDTVSKPSAYDILHPDVCKLWVCEKTYKSWQEAVDELGKTFQGFRHRRQPDYTTVKDAIGGKTLAKPVERAAFGLPIQFYYSSLGGKSAGLQSEHYDRRSSPLLFRVSRLANGTYALILIWFHSVFLPKSEKLKLTGKGISATGGLPNNHLIKTFLTGPDAQNHSSLMEKGLELIEVRYV